MLLICTLPMQYAIHRFYLVRPWEKRAAISRNRYTFSPALLPPHLQPSLTTSSPSAQPCYLLTFSPALLPPHLQPRLATSSPSAQPCYLLTFSPALLPPHLQPRLATSSPSAQPCYLLTFSPDLLPPHLQPSLASSSPSAQPCYLLTFSPDLLPPHLQPSLATSSPSAQATAHVASVPRRVLTTTVLVTWPLLSWLWQTAPYLPVCRKASSSRTQSSGISQGPRGPNPVLQVVLPAPARNKACSKIRKLFYFQKTACR